MAIQGLNHFFERPPLYDDSKDNFQIYVIMYSKWVLLNKILKFEKNILHMICHFEMQNHLVSHHHMNSSYVNRGMARSSVQPVYNSLMQIKTGLNELLVTCYKTIIIITMHDVHACACMHAPGCKWNIFMQQRCAAQTD